MTYFPNFLPILEDFLTKIKEINISLVSGHFLTIWCFKQLIGCDDIFFYNFCQFWRIFGSTVIRDAIFVNVSIFSSFLQTFPQFELSFGFQNISNGFLNGLLETIGNRYIFLNGLLFKSRNPLEMFGNQRKPQNNRFLLNSNFESQGKEIGLREKAGGRGGGCDS